MPVKRTVADSPRPYFAEGNMCFWNCHLRSILKRQCVLNYTVLIKVFSSWSLSWSWVYSTIPMAWGENSILRDDCSCSRCSFSSWIIALLWAAQLFIQGLKGSHVSVLLDMLCIYVYVYIIISNLRILKLKKKTKQLLPLLSVLSFCLVGPGAWIRAIRLGSSIFTFWPTLSVLY